MQNLDKLIALQEQYTRYNPWFHSCDADFYLKSMITEIGEATHELNTGDNEALEDELGDVLWLMINTLKKAESLNQINIERLIDRSIEKFHERMPYIREGRRVESQEERTKLWNEAKKKQKERKKISKSSIPLENVVCPDCLGSV